MSKDKKPAPSIERNPEPESGKRAVPANNRTLILNSPQLLGAVMDALVSNQAVQQAMLAELELVHHVKGQANAGLAGLMFHVQEPTAEGSKILRAAGPLPPLRPH